MKGVRFTKAELALLNDLLSMSEDDPKALKLKASIVAKLAAAVDAPKGVQVQPVEDALVAASHGKVIKLEGGHAIASRRCTDNRVTPEDAALVGAWMARQGWLTGPMTLLDVLNKWPSWLPKARVTAPPPLVAPGLNGVVTQGTPGQGRGGADRRPPPGFGGGRKDPY